MQKKEISNNCNKEIVIKTNNSDIFIDGVELESNGTIEYDNKYIEVTEQVENEQTTISIVQKEDYKPYGLPVFDSEIEKLHHITNPEIIVKTPYCPENNKIKIKLNKDNIYRILIKNKYGDITLKEVGLTHSSIETDTGNISISSPRQIGEDTSIDEVATVTGNIGIYYSIGVESVKTITGDIEISVSKDINHIENEYGSTDIRHTRFTKPDSSIKTGPKGVNIKASYLPETLSIESDGHVDINSSSIDVDGIKIKCLSLAFDGRNRVLKNK